MKKTAIHTEERALRTPKDGRTYWKRKIEESDDPEKTIADNAGKLSHEADVEGITGFMYGAAVSILSQCWLYGEYLRKWHNKEYNCDGDGVVNPAIITIETE